VREDRDLLLIRADRQDAHRFRCNSYGDALCCAFIAARLIRPRSARAWRASDETPRTRL
jgi:hypothetical protein